MTDPSHQTPAHEMPTVPTNATALSLPDETPAYGSGEAVTSAWRLALREFLNNRLAVVAVLVIIFFLLLCFVGPLIYHTNQTATNPLLSNDPPSAAHVLGTEEHGFDELGQIMDGGQSALEIGFLASLIATVVGTLYGAVSGLLGGWIDGALMRFVDILLSIPALVVILVLATRYSATVIEESLIIGAFSWLVPARLVRGEVLALRVREFVIACRMMGGRTPRIVLRHLIPNTLSVTIVNITFQIANAILAESYLGFLGFGLQYPQASWGDMLGNAQANVSSGYWWLVYPVGACLVMIVLACNLIGDALRDAFDVRLRRR